VPARSKHVRLGLGVVLLVAVLVRLGVVLATPGFRPVADALDFDRLAVALAEGRGYGAAKPEAVPGGGATAFRPPGLPVALAAVYTLTGTDVPHDRWQAGRLLEVLLGVATVALIALLALRLAGPGAGLAAGALAAVYPPLLVPGASLLSEALFLPLELGAILAALAHRRSPHPWRWAVLAGIACGLAALTRGNGLLLVPPLALAAGTGARRSWRAPAALAAAAALVVVPWTIRNAVQLHAFVPVTTETGYTLRGTYQEGTAVRRDYPALWQVPYLELLTLARDHPHMQEAELDGRLTAGALGYVRDHPTSLLSASFWNSVRMVHGQGPKIERLQELSNGVASPLGLAGVYGFWALAVLALVAAAGTGAWRVVPGWLWLLVALLWATTVWTAGGVGRYRLPCDPLLLVIAGAGLAAVSSRRPVRVA